MPWGNRRKTGCVFIQCYGVSIKKNYCSYGYNYLYDDIKEPTFDPVVEGAREEDNKWRGREHDFFNDVKVKAILFDQILVSQNLKDHVVIAGCLRVHRRWWARGRAFGLKAMICRIPRGAVLRPITCRCGRC